MHHVAMKYRLTLLEIRRLIIGVKYFYLRPITQKRNRVPDIDKASRIVSHVPTSQQS